MESLPHKVESIPHSDRQALERLLGESLRDDQQVLIRVIDANGHSHAPPTAGGSPSMLPDWCDVYDGLTEEEVHTLERSILNRADLSRSCE